jgi:hypothetical protein
MVRNLLSALLLGSVLAHGQHLVFTMVTPASSPVRISAVESSRDFGFQSLTLVNDSDKIVESILFKVVLTKVQTRHEPEVMDGGHVYARLEPGDRKSVDVFLGRMRALSLRAKELKLEVARAIVTVEAVDFSDGSQWTGDPSPAQDIPIRVDPLPR